MTHFTGEGNLGQTPELRTVESGGESKSVVDLRVYFDRQVPTDDGYEDRGGFWMNVALWGKRAEHAARIYAKGHRVEVNGYLIDDSYEKDGVKIVRQSIVARSVNLVPTSKIESINFKTDAAA